MIAPPVLPPGYQTRVLTTDDAEAVYRLMARSEVHDVGEEVIELADIIADWQRPGYDLSSCSLGVFDEDELIAYAEHTGNGRLDASVDPGHRGLGIGTALASWLQALGRSLGLDEIGMPVPQGSDGDRLLTALGYHVRWNSWVLQLPPGTVVPPRPLPPGYELVEISSTELAAMHEVIEDAFLEWSVRPREPFGDFEAHTVRRPGFEPWLLRGVRDGEGNLVAAAVLTKAPPAEVFVDRLATRVDQRNQGLAQALLAECFAVGREHGATKFCLSTDSRTGALDLYLKVGMKVTSNWVNRGITL